MSTNSSCRHASHAHICLPIILALLPSFSVTRKSIFEQLAREFFIVALLQSEAIMVQKLVHDTNFDNDSVTVQLSRNNLKCSIYRHTLSEGKKDCPLWVYSNHSPKSYSCRLSREKQCNFSQQCLYDVHLFMSVYSQYINKPLLSDFLETLCVHVHISMNSICCKQHKRTSTDV